jgi:hypothetical protein
VEPSVLAQLEHLALVAERAGTSGHPQALSCTQAYAAGVVQTLISLGLIDADEAEDWRERLREHLGPEFGRRTKLTITSEHGGEFDAVSFAYTVCRDVSLAALAIQYDTAADAESIAAAIAAEHQDQSARLLRACRLGFSDRGKPVVPHREL